MEQPSVFNRSLLLGYVVFFIAGYIIGSRLNRKSMRKIAIIGASYLQAPLIEKAKQMGLETHVFAWAANDVGEKIADYFYPISIVEKEEILSKCIEIGIDGICTIASDLAAITANYVAAKMRLVGNSWDCTLKSTNKHLMRKCFKEYGDPSPKSIRVGDVDDLDGIELLYPVIVKPLDRSGSRGITKLESADGLEEAIKVAKEQGFEDAALVEEFVEGQEYSIEYISFKGKHQFLALTYKYTTGAPHFIETGHLEPAPIDGDKLSEIKRVTEHALDSLGIKYGASHTEIKINKDGIIKIIEIGGRMGGDFIGSTLVKITTGVDFVEQVIRVSLGEEPEIKIGQGAYAGVRFIFNKNDINIFNRLKEERSDLLIDYEINDITENKVTDSASRFGYFIVCANTLEEVQTYLPKD